MIDRRLAGRLQLVPPPAPVSLDAPRLTYWQRLALGVALIVSIALMASCAPEPLPAEARVYVERRILIEFPGGEAFKDRPKKQRWECREVKP